MIDKTKGHLKLTNSLELKPNLNFNLIENQKLGEVQEIRDLANGYKWLDIKNVKVNDKYFIMSLCFKDEKLVKLSLLLNDNPFDLISDWNSWNEKEEKDKIKKYQDWLNQELNNETAFDWGKVWVNYDTRSCSSSIEIEYN